MGLWTIFCLPILVVSCFWYVRGTERPWGVKRSEWDGKPRHGIRAAATKYAHEETKGGS